MRDALGVLRFLERKIVQRNRGGVRTPGEAGIGRAALNPLGEDGDFGGAEGLLGRHREVFVFAADGLEEEAFGGIAGHDDRTGGAAGLPVGLRIETEAALLFFSLGHS